MSCLGMFVGQKGGEVGVCKKIAQMENLYFGKLRKKLSFCIKRHIIIWHFLLRKIIFVIGMGKSKNLDNRCNFALIFS